MVRSERITELLNPILYFALQNRKKECKLFLCDSPTFMTHLIRLAQVGLLHLSCFALLLFSADRNFGVALNKPFSQFASMDLPVVQGTYADFLILASYRLITNGHPSMLNIVDCLLTMIVNISPYLKSLSLVTCTKLLSLFHVYGNPSHLASNKASINSVALMLELFNNLIQYQFHGSIHLVYGIICHPQTFYELRDIGLKTMESDLANLNVQPEKSDASRPASHSSDHDTPKSDDFNEDRVSPPPTTDAPRLHRDEKWVQTIKEKLPLRTILRLIEVLLPQIQSLCDEDDTAADEQQIVRFLNDATLVGLLPVPHPIVVRRYQPNEASTVWFTSYIWGTIYLRCQDPPLWVGSKIRLFQIKTIE